MVLEKMPSGIFFLCHPLKRQKNVRCKVKGYFTGDTSGEYETRE